MSDAASSSGATDGVTEFTLSEMKDFVLGHFEEFMNRRNLSVADVNFAPGFIDHSADLPPGTPAGPSGPKAHMAEVLGKFPDIYVTVEDVIAEGDKVVVRSRWTATESESGRKLRMGGIVIWRVAQRQLIERWAYTEKPRPAD